MAAYNGSTHIEEQLASILSELEAHDEVVVVNDCSSDNTADVIAAMADNRIRLINSPNNVGYVRTFERALAEARGEYVFLSDQDDIWIPGRVKLMIDAMAEKAMVATNCKHVEGPMGRFHELRLSSAYTSRPVRNIIGIVVGYRLHWGCAMAIRAAALKQVLPFPPYMTESHDQWIAMVGNVNRSIAYVEEDTILHRLHGENLTPPGVRNIRKILRARSSFLRNVVTAVSRSRGHSLMQP